MIAGMVTAFLGWLHELAARLLVVVLTLVVWLGRVAMYLGGVLGLVLAGLQSWEVGLIVGGLAILLGLLVAYVAARLLVTLLILMDDADHLSLARFLPPMYGPGSRHWEKWEKERNEITRRDKAKLALQAAIGFQL